MKALTHSLSNREHHKDTTTNTKKFNFESTQNSLSIRQIFTWIQKNYQTLYRCYFQEKEVRTNPDSGSFSDLPIRTLLQNAISIHLLNFVRDRMKQHKSVKVEELGIVFQLYHVKQTQQKENINPNSKFSCQEKQSKKREIHLTFETGWFLNKYQFENHKKSSLSCADFKSRNKLIYPTTESYYKFIANLMPEISQSNVKTILTIFKASLMDLLDLGKDINMRFDQIGEFRISRSKKFAKMMYFKEFVNDINLAQGTNMIRGKNTDFIKYGETKIKSFFQIPEINNRVRFIQYEGHVKTDKYGKPMYEKQWEKAVKENYSRYSISNDRKKIDKAIFYPKDNQQVRQKLNHIKNQGARLESKYNQLISNARQTDQ